MKGIEYLRREVASLSSSIAGKIIDALMSKFTSVIVFAPDRALSSAAQEEFDKLGPEARETAQLQQALGVAFFPELYVAREELAKIEAQVPLMRLLVVHGFPGVGKTILLMRLCLTLAGEAGEAQPLLYLDLAGKDAALGVKTERGLRHGLRSGLYERLWQEYYIERPDADFLSAWVEHCVAIDPDFRDVRDYLTEWARTLSSATTRGQLLAKRRASRQLTARPREASLATLVAFLKARGFIGFCLDNVDGLELPLQEEFLDEARRLSDELGIAVVVALRTYNWRRLHVENQGAAYYLEEQVTYQQTHRQKPPTEGESVELFEEILARRLRCVQRYTQKAELDGFLAPLQEPGIGSFTDFERRFWGFFRLLTHSFVDDGIGEFCNWDLRQVMLAYFHFITHVLVGKDAPYTLETLLKRETKLQVTLLRTCFFRWLVLGDEDGRPERLKVPNIFVGDTLGLHPAYALLSYLSNHSSTGGRERVPLAAALDDLARVGVDHESAMRVVEELARGSRSSPLGFILRDRHRSIETGEVETLELLPKGRFFVQRVCVTREYAFWAAMLAEGSSCMVTGSFSMRETYDDEFKLRAVLRYAEEVLLPAVAERVPNIRQMPLPSSSRAASGHAFYLGTYELAGRLYLWRLIESLTATVEYMDTSASERQRFREACRGISRKVADLEAQLSGAGT
jgi:hypothetical protein